jgi:hypothetical protein
MMRCTPIIAAALLIVGCGGSEPRLVPVAGKVMIDGKPLAYGTITVVPTNGRPAYGQIGEDGSFSLTTRSLNDGCIAGEHKLEITARRIISAGAQEWLAPKRYASAETSGLTLIVDKPEKDALFGSNGKAKSRSSKPGTPPAGPPAKEAKTETKILASCPSARQRRTERLAQPLPTRTHRSIMTEPASFSACRTSRRNSVIVSR